MTNGHLSPRYQQQSHLLFERHQKGEITRQEYDEQKKKLAEQEVQSTAQSQTIQTSLAIQEYEAEQLVSWQKEQKEQAEKKRLFEEREQQRLANLAETNKRAQEERVYLAQADVLRLEAEKRDQEERIRLADAKSKASMSVSYEQYVLEEIPATLLEMRKSAKRNRGWSSFFQLVIIVVSTIAAGIVNIPDVPRLVISIMTITVAIVNGVIWIFKFKERSINSQQTADTIEYERNLYRLGIKDYANKAKDPLSAGQLLAGRVEDLKNEQNKRQQLLEQTPGKSTETASVSRTATA